MDKFSFNYYKECIIKGNESGYIFTSYKNYDSVEIKDKKTILMRHDVDFNLINAHKMAKIEYDLGVKSTYFVRLHAVNYNLFEINNFKLLGEIISMGHEIGLHFEPDFYIGKNGSMADYIMKESTFIGDLLGVNIEGIAVHEPSRRGNNIDEKVMAETNLKYEAYLIPNNYKYISDSGGRWREGDIMEWINKKNKICVNTHPVWWYDNTPLENY